MKRQLLGLLGAVTLAGAGLIGFAAPAAAVVVPTDVAKVVSAPDDGCPTPWARDTFTRTTTLNDNGDGKTKVLVSDSGSFTTNKGQTAPMGGGGIANKVTGLFVGSFDFLVDGAIKSTLPTSGRTISYSNVLCKPSNGGTDPNSPALPTTGNWWNQYFNAGATTTGIDHWEWTYSTTCELLTETYDTAPIGNIFGLNCVTATDPTLVQPTVHNGNGTLTVPTIVGVHYDKASGSVAAGTSFTVNASAQAGYALADSSASSWNFVVNNPAAVPPPHVNVYPGTPRPTSNRAYIVPKNATWQTVFNAAHFPDANIKGLQKWNATHTVSSGGKTNSPVYSTWWNLNAGSVIALPNISCGTLA